MDRRPTDSPTLREVPGKGWVAHDPELRASASGATADEATANLRDLVAAYPEVTLRETTAGTPVDPTRLDDAGRLRVMNRNQYELIKRMERLLNVYGPALEEIAARDWYPRGWHVARGGGQRLSIHDMREFADNQLAHDEHCPGCIAERALRFGEPVTEPAGKDG